MKDAGLRSHANRDVGAGIDQRLPRNANHAFLRAAAGVGREVADRLCGDVSADDSEVAGGEFEDGRATVTADALCGVRDSESSNEHARSITIVIYSVKGNSA